MRPDVLGSLSMLSALLSRLTLLALLVVHTPAQSPIVAFGDPVRQGNIATSGQKATFFFSAQQGDVLQLTFCSLWYGYPTNSYAHRVDITNGVTQIGSVVGCGALTKPLPSTATYTLTVSAVNNSFVGWYAFQIDRLNNPVGADRMALNWNLKGSIKTRGAFAVYSVLAEAGSTVALNFTSEWYGYPRNLYIHYAELFDAKGKSLTRVDGNGTSPAVPIPTTGLYTVVIAARNYEDVGWYAGPVTCVSQPGTPCDTTPYSGNYGIGLPGTNGVPSLSASAPPKLGHIVPLAIGNSYGPATSAFLLLGTDSDNQVFPAFGGTLLVAQPAIAPIALPTGGGSQPLPIPYVPVFTGMGIALQVVMNDPGAGPGGLAFTRGLCLIVAP